LVTPSENSEPLRLHAAYTLAEMGQPGVSLLGEILLSESEEFAYRNAGYGLSAAGGLAVPLVLKYLKASNISDDAMATLLFVVGELGMKAWGAVPSIIGLLACARNVYVRRIASEALGPTLLGCCLGGEDSEKAEYLEKGIQVLCQAIDSDEDEQVSCCIVGQ